MLLSSFLLAIGSIRRNLLRSFLTMLGIVIGVAAVITMVVIGNGATEAITRDIENMGTNMLVVMPGQGFGPGRGTAAAFEAADAEAIARQVSAVTAVAPTASSSLMAIWGNENWSTTVTGIDTGYLAVRDWPIVDGRAFTAGEVRAGQAVCIIGATIRSELFGRLEPVGERIRLGQLSCTVVGLLEEKGQASFGQDQDNIVLVPLRLFQRRISGNTDVQSILASARSAADVDRARRDITYLMRERRRISPGEDDDFSVRDTRELIQTLTSATQVMTALLGAVAAISLFVGGIGIMNIMLVSVTERTREIGIRLAIGALERDVLLQFLVEAMVLAGLGGLIGILLAVGLSAVFADLMGVPLILDPGIMLLAFGFSALVGIVFGYFPARRAAHLNPIDALRHE